MLRIAIQFPSSMSREDAARTARIIAQLFVTFGFRGRNAAASMAPASYATCIETLSRIAADHPIVVDVEPLVEDVPLPLESQESK